MLAYGWVFHMGFFNFYLSMGLCFWALALAWEWHARSVAIAVPLLCLAYVAHALPVVWTAACWRTSGWRGAVAAQARVYVTAGCLLGIVAGADCGGACNAGTRWSVRRSA